MWRGGLPPFGCEAVANSGNLVQLKKAGGRFATQRGQAPSPQFVCVPSIVVLAQQPLKSRTEAAFDFGFDVRGEIVDHVLHDQLCGGAQFAVQVQQVIRVLIGDWRRCRFYGRSRRCCFDGR